MHRTFHDSRLIALTLCGLLAATQCPAEPLASLTAEEIAAGWIMLFDGETTFGWTATSDANWTVYEGAVAADHGQPGWLTTNCEFGDYELSAEFRAPAATNSGIFLRTPRAPTDPTWDCSELNIAGKGVSPFTTGAFVGRAKTELDPPDENWHRFDVRAEGGSFAVSVDGTQCLMYDDPQPVRRGRIGLQFNRGAVAFRNIRLRPLSTDDLLGGNAAGLDAWSETPGHAAKFTLEADGTLHVHNGNGELETRQSWADFVLQLEAKVNGQGLNSGVFFRCIPREFWQGYECQIHNGYRDGNRSQPVDFGTGGFYRRQPARRVVADDGKWFAMTLVASGESMAAWVDGYPVSDWTDRRAPDANPRKGLRLEPGTISLQAHDPTTDLEFRRIRIAELPSDDGAKSPFRTME